MRRQSLKAAKRQREALDSRLWLIERTGGACDWCARPGAHEHHVANGQNRGLSLGKLFAVCWVCADCHRELHDLPKRASVCIGLALIRYHRQDQYDLEAFYKLIARRFPSEEMIEHWWQRMLIGKTRTP